MGKRVILILLEGSFEQGFPVILRISEEGAPAETEIQVQGQLPCAPNILAAFKNWQSAYRQMVRLYSRIKPKPAQLTNVSFQQLGDDFKDCFNDWLNSGTREWQKIRDGLQRNLSDTDEIRFIIQTNNIQLRQLPWHLWDLVEQYPKAEVALSTSEYQPPQKLTINNLGHQVRILAILGNSEGIDIEKDRTFLAQLSNQAEIEFLVEPQLEELNDHLWKHSWDIIFFAGHSCSQEKGTLHLNQTDVITLDQLRYALKKAIAQGLRLAIFNSCDGLGLAKELADLHIPQVIVMREPVPDKVAQEFLKHFLTAFATGQSLCASVREARERLQGLESRFPCASWLPVICTNPAEVPMTWSEWCSPKAVDSTTNGTNRQTHPVLSIWHRLCTALLASVVVTSAIAGVRHLGLLQTWELQAYDQMLRRRPDEAPDPRLLVVAITPKDFQLPEQQQRKKGTSLSDLALARLLDKLETDQPRSIGSDIFHDFPIDSQQTELKTRMQQSDRFFAVCNVDKLASESDISPPPDVPEDHQGFSNILRDSDGIIRRQILSMDTPANSRCTTSTALSVQLALRYLKDEGITPKFTQEGNWQLGKVVLWQRDEVVFKRLQAPSGGYQKADTWGNQVLLNYRSYRSPLRVADIVTLTDVLRDRVKPKFVHDRIVLIGVFNPTSRDNFLTPYSTGRSNDQKLPGVILHAQMVSQILSAVLNGRPLLWVWSWWGEVLWIWGWSFVGGLLVWRFQSPGRLGLGVAAMLGVLYGISFCLMTQGGWVPLVPSALALVITGSSALAYSRFQTQQQQLTSVVCHHDLDEVTS